MRIIITEQQFNLILLGEGRKATDDEEINKTYLGIVKYWNDIYEKTGELFNKYSTPSSKINTDTNTKPKKQNPDYSWLINNQLLPKFYIDTNHKQKQEEKKNEKYLGIVKYWNDIYEKTGELLFAWDSTSHFLPSSSKINTDTNTKPEKINPDYLWLNNNQLLPKFYIDTDNKQRQEEIKQNEYKRLVDKYKNNPETFNTKGKGKNLDYQWLSYYGFDLNKFYEEIKYEKNQSIGENIVKEILNNMSIKYIFNKGTYKCRGEKGCELRPDFTLENKGVKIWIEYDGEHHFKKVRRSKNETDETIENRFKTMVKNDTIKNQFCSSNNIKMIRISYKTNTYDGILNELEKILEKIRENKKDTLYLSEDYPELGWNDPRLKNYTPNNTNF